MYLALYVKGIHAPRTSLQDLYDLEEYLSSEMYIWPELKTWLRDLRSTLDIMQRDSRNPFSHDYTFDDSVAAAQEVGHRINDFQNRECQALKEQLVDMEADGSGRVLLTRFYSHKGEDGWPFIESTAYLRNLGALDETDPHRPRVIIPNFLSSPSNCVVPSSFYSVCCRDECEALFASVELKVGEPSATPGLLAQIVSGLESDTMQVPRNLSAAQLGRLGEIAAVHDGRIPLHGRLFAQWMHHAYPRECRFPHEAGTTSPLSQDEFEGISGESAEASDEEVAALMERSLALGHKTVDDLPWTLSEELIAPLTEDWQVPRARPDSPRFNRVLVLVVVVVSAALKMVHSTHQLRSAS